ncbi:PREDICTED: cysteine-rich and transmembrane domain-containing protein A-like isoform X1 [Brassica oleracea var. oleracea]|nr:PREDICTED: cysteine-rich and transmembrane domain-containing protein A-like isoform X1 [Brassica oleracea var. oleracea]
MTQYNQPPVGVPPPQGYPPEGYPPQGYPPQGYPPQGYPQQSYPPPYAPQYPPPQQNQQPHQQSSTTGCLQGWLKDECLPKRSLKIRNRFSLKKKGSAEVLVHKYQLNFMGCTSYILSE